MACGSPPLLRIRRLRQWRERPRRACETKADAQSPAAQPGRCLIAAPAAACSAAVTSGSWTRFRGPVGGGLRACRCRSVGPACYVTAATLTAQSTLPRLGGPVRRMRQGWRRSQAPLLRSAALGLRSILVALQVLGQTLERRDRSRIAESTPSVPTAPAGDPSVALHHCARQSGWH